jgi:uncharacterized protein YjbI with pentapeptide repeats
MAGSDRDQERPNGPRATREWPREPLPRDRVPTEKLLDVIEQHEEWLRTNAQPGKRADFHLKDLSGQDLAGHQLSRAILRGASLKGADLRGTNLSRADLSDADLSDTQLQDADLSEANLQCAELRGATLWNADLQDADLTDAVGLLGDRIAGANVCGARLPEAILDFDGLEHVAEASRNAGRLFVSMLLGCAYAGLTIAATSDADLLTGSSSSKLPIIETLTPIVGFYALAPLLLLGLYVYLQLSLQQLWEGLADLPAVFPDGRPLHKTAYPWLFNGMVRAYLPRLKAGRTPPWRVQQTVCTLAAWWVVPLTLLLFWGRALRRHGGYLTSWQIALFLLSLGVALVFRALAHATLQGQFRERAGKREAGAWVAPWKCGVGALMLLLVASGLGTLSFGAIEGIPPTRPDFPLHLKNSWKLARQDIPARSPRIWVPNMLAAFGVSSFADLHKAEVSTRPDNWTGETRAEAQRVRGANLEKHDLRYADADHAFLAHANLADAQLPSANLAEAQLQGAELPGAHLEWAYLRKADLRWALLQGAHLQGADLEEAKLGWADLQNVTSLGTGTTQQPVVLLQAHLVRSNLRGATLPAADLRFADLRAAGLQAADLTAADLRWADLRQARIDQGILQQANCSSANFTGATLSQAKLSRADCANTNFGQAQLPRADLSQATCVGARLWKADLRGANLRQAKCWSANLKEARLIGADLQYAELWACNLQRADLRLADLRRTRLQGAILQRATLASAVLQHADVRGAALQGANLTAADLGHTNLWGANLQGALLRRANLVAADLRGADLREARGLTQHQLDAAVTDAKTQVTLPLRVRHGNPGRSRKPRARRLP